VLQPQGSHFNEKKGGGPSDPARGISTHVYDRVDNEMMERRSSATKASTGERRREINKEYCCPYTQLMLFYALVRNIYPIREHCIPINSLSVPPPTVVY
jgi:hypothetical protein